MARPLGNTPSSAPTRNTTRELEAFGQVRRAQHDLILDLAIEQFVGISDERDLFEELVDNQGVLERRSDELVEILHPPVGLDGVLGASD